MDIASTLRNAQTLISANRLDDAISLCAEFCAEHSNDASGWLLYGTVVAQSGQLANAERHFRQALAIAPDNSQISTSLAKALLAQGKDDEAYELLQKMIRSGGKDALAMLGDLAGKSGRFDQAVSAYGELFRMEPDNAGVAYKLGVAYRGLGQLDNAAAAFKRAIALIPTFSAALNDLGAIYQDRGDVKDAEHYYRKAIECEPTNSVFLYNLGTLCFKQDRADEAIVILKQALAAHPDHTEALNILGLCYCKIFSYERAVDCFERVTKLSPDHLDAIYNLGNALLRQGELDAADTCFAKALSLNKDFGNAQIARAAVLEKKGDYSAAFSLLEPMMDSDTDGIHAAPVFGAVCRRLGRQHEAIDLLEHLVAGAQSPNHSHVSTYYALGDLCDDVALYDKAFAHYDKANLLSQAAYAPDASKKACDEIISVFSEDNLSRLPRAPEGGPHPIFIVGMPRSGTSLVEKILDTHPDVHGAGELPYIAFISGNIQRNLASDQAYPHCVLGMTQDLIGRFAAYYKERIAELSRDARYVVDKMPYNFLELGLIKMLFPDAKTIHCTRNPMDTCLSIYFHEFSSNHPYATSLESLGQYYIDYLRLMEHWKQVLPGEIFEVNYDRLIDDPTTVVRELIDFLSLPWDPACLEFHKNKRLTNTPSYAQVNKPIYTSSRGRWTNYEQHIQRLIQLLEDARCH